MFFAVTGMLAACSSSTTSDAGSDGGCISVPANLPSALDAPSGVHPFIEVYGSGTQNYTCVLTDAGSAAWGAAVPAAQLQECDATGADVGMHSAGPTWTWTSDNSDFVGNKPAGTSAASPDDPVNDIPWLLLPKKAGTDAGTLGPALYVQRVNTSGGVIFPDAGCDEGAADAGYTVSVPYHANYIFYEAD